MFTLVEQVLSQGPEEAKSYKLNKTPDEHCSQNMDLISS